MVRVEATRVGYGREPTPEELADPEAQLSAKYIGLLQEAHPLIDPDKFEPTDEFMERLNENIEEVVATVPNINPDALKKMVLENPLFVKGWVYGGTFTEFHYLALNWNDDMWGGNREIAERYYEMTEIERNFLLKGVLLVSPPPMS